MMTIIQQIKKLFISARRRYRLLKWRVFAKFPSLCNGIVLTRVHGKKMYLDLSDRAICETLYTRGIWEGSETVFLKRLIGTDMVVVDLGANVGYYTLLAAEKVGVNGKVFAFEPEPTRYELLEKNIKVNNYNNVIAVQKAASNKTGTARLYLNPNKNKGDHRVYDSFDGRESVLIDTITLDDFFKDEDYPIHVIKMDIQGAEMAALEGMKSIINRSHGLTILTEFWPAGMQKSGFLPIEFLNSLVGQGFRLHILADEGQSIERVTPEQIMKICKEEIYLVCRKGYEQVGC